MSALAVAAIALVASGASVLAQGKDLSDQSINTLINYAWTITPPKFTLPTGKEILVNKEKRNEIVVPLDAAREVVRVARLTASAQMCGLAEEQAANYQTLMARETAKNKWSDQQMLFINQLHLFTVMLMTGKVQLVEKEGEKEVVLQDTKIQPKADACTDTERGKVRDQIKAYIESGATAKKN
ncbi:MAG: hypothetical protein KGP27_10600 [Hyphomicrobiales bacterium]|nr:hypothetical protein [Hyphomicrobiales bacterium]